MAFDNFLVEVGLYGSLLEWSDKDFGHLATESMWFCNFWNLLHSFATDVSFRKKDLVHGVWENDRSLMSEFFRIGYRGKELLALNIVHHYHNLLHLSDISKCNGIALNEYIVSDCLEISTLHVFPRKEPTLSDHRLMDRSNFSAMLGDNHTPNKPWSICPFSAYLLPVVRQ